MQTVCGVDISRSSFTLWKVPDVLPSTTPDTQPMPPIYGHIGAVLRVAREKAGRTQEEVANAVGLTRTSLTNIEKGRQKLLVHTLAEIAVFLSCSASELLAEVEARAETQRPAFKMPQDFSKKIQAQIADMIVRGSDTDSHAKPPSQPHPRKSRNAAR